MNLKMNQEQQFAEAAHDATACDRALELISYLYNEASAAEAKDFERHTRGCVSCRTELAEFGVVRESIGDWRTSALGSIVNAPANAENLTPVFDAARVGPTRQRSALAALREFFTLSPGWMRAATAFAALIFCALAIIAFTHFSARTEPQTVFVEKPSDKIYTKQQADEMVAHAKQESAAVKQENPDRESRQHEVSIASSSSTNGPTRLSVRKNATVPSPALANASPVRHGSLHNSARERQQLAEVLLPQETKDEEKLPRLSDLLENDSN